MTAIGQKRPVIRSIDLPPECLLLSKICRIGNSSISALGVVAPRELDDGMGRLADVRESRAPEIGFSM